MDLGGVRKVSHTKQSSQGLDAQGTRTSIRVSS